VDSHPKVKYQVRYQEGACSSSIPVISRVPQGSVLGPCLFLFYINDIADSLSSTVHLFADDTMIYLAVKNEHGARLFQDNLDKVIKLTTWEKRWTMEFHPDKCEVITISWKRNPVQYPYTLNSHQYLGVQISHNLRWDKHTSHRLYHIQGQLHSWLPSSQHQYQQSTLSRPRLPRGDLVW